MRAWVPEYFSNYEVDPLLSTFHSSSPVSRGLPTFAHSFLFLPSVIVTHLQTSLTNPWEKSLPSALSCQMLHESKEEGPKSPYFPTVGHFQQPRMAMG